MSTTNISRNFNGTVLSEPAGNSLQLWLIVVISLCALVVVSILFVMTVLLCRIVRERRANRYTYSTRQHKGSGRSSYHIRSQENLDSSVANVHYHKRSAGASIPDDRSVTPMEASEEPPHEIICTIRSREDETRMRSRTNESERVIEVENDRGGHMYDIPFDGDTLDSQQHLINSTSDRQNIVESSRSDSTNETFQNDRVESLSPSTRESKQNKMPDMTGNAGITDTSTATTVIPTLANDSQLLDIPGFQDPELQGENNDGNGLCVSAPPNIYSSQILTNDRESICELVSDEQSTQHVYRAELTTSSMGIVGSDVTDVTLNTETPKEGESDSSSPHERTTEAGYMNISGKFHVESCRLTPEGGREESGECINLPEDDVLYARPVIPQGDGVAVKNNDIEIDPRSVDPQLLFDDPGYTKGMMMQIQQQATELQIEDCAGSTEDSTAAPVKHFHLLQQPNLMDKSRDVSEMKTLSAQVSCVPAMKSSIDSLSFLNYDERELDDLDPLVVSCLRTPNMSDTDDEIIISEV